jgi:hypothetical protein
MPYDKNKIYPEYFIYKLCSDECDDFYVGSTRDITSRKNRHKTTCNRPNIRDYNSKKYRTIRDKGGFENWRMVTIEVLNNVTKLQAEMREEVHRVQLNAVLNSQRASCGGLTKQEYDKLYREENKEKIKENDKQYYEKNRDNRIEYQKQYREENIEKVKETQKQYQEKHKERIRGYQKQYQEENKEQLREQKKQYREEHKEEISAHKGKKVDCVCGARITNGHKTRHERTQKHQNYVDSLEPTLEPTP